MATMETRKVGLLQATRNNVAFPIEVREPEAGIAEFTSPEGAVWRCSKAELVWILGELAPPAVAPQPVAAPV